MLRSSGGTISAKIGLLQAGAAAAMHKPIRKRVIAYSVVTHTDVPSNGSPCIWQRSASANVHVHVHQQLFRTDP